MCGNMMTITSCFKYELQSLKKECSNKAKDTSDNSRNSISTNASQNVNDFQQIISLKNRILLLESENKLLKDDIANKQNFIEILLNFNGNNIQNRHNKNTWSSLIQKNTMAGKTEN